MGTVANINQVKNLLVASNLSYHVVGDNALEVDSIYLDGGNKKIFNEGMKKLHEQVELVETGNSLLIKLISA
jgi:hypothetical protein